MHSQSFQQKLSNPVEKQMKNLLELQIKTMQGFKYINPSEWISLKKPEEFFEKHVDIFIQNSHNTLNFMEDVLSMMECNWKNMAQDMFEGGKSMKHDIERTARNNMSGLFAKGMVGMNSKVVTPSIKKSVPKSKMASSAKSKSLKSSTIKKVGLKSASVAKKTIGLSSKTLTPKKSSVKTTGVKSSASKTMKPKSSGLKTVGLKSSSTKTTTIKTGNKKISPTSSIIHKDPLSQINRLL